MRGSGEGDTSPFSCLGGEPPPHGGSGNVKSVSDGLLCHAVAAPAAGALLTALGQPEQDHKGKQQDHGDPCEGAGCH
jgi:hypothetical protein